jgi:glycosyltransferase A (GT-A) superfamily protein (DUF2064 family)
VRAIVVAAEAVHEVLVERTTSWAHQLDPDPIRVGGVAQAERAALEVGEPVVVVWADTPRLGRVHADGVRGDLEAGADLVVAPTLDGGIYLLAMRAPRPDLLGSPFAQVLEAAARDRLETGMLRHERRLARPEDVRALLADPLLPQAVRRVIRP